MVTSQYRLPIFLFHNRQSPACSVAAYLLYERHKTALRLGIADFMPYLCPLTFKLETMTVVMVKSSFLFLNEVGGTEILLIAVVVLLLFGGNKIPELMRGLGKGMREFNDAKNNVRREIEEGIRDVQAGPKPAAPAATTTATAAPAQPIGPAANEAPATPATPENNA